MRVRLSLILVLIFSMTAQAGSRPLGIAEPASTAAPQEKELTPEEKREAREVAERFSKLMADKRDIGPLMDEMFVSDYAERLRLQNLRDPIVSFEENVPLDAAPAELWDYVVAVLNLWAMMVEWQDVGRCPEKPKGGKGHEQPCEQGTFPPVVMKFIRGDRRLANFISGLTGEKISLDQAGDHQEDDGEKEDGQLFKDTRDLRELTASLDKAGSLMREHLAKIQAAGKAHAGGSEDEREADVELRTVTEEEGFYGWPAGSHLICVETEVFHLDLVRIDGRLKILAVTPLTDSK